MVIRSRFIASLAVLTVPLVICGGITRGAASAIGPAAATGPKVVSVDARLLDTESWIMGPSGYPIPPLADLLEVSRRYVDPASPLFPGQPLFPVDVMNPLFTPEGLYPITGIKNLELNPSVDQGVSILNSTIADQTADGNDLVVVGYSQSATISSLEMRDLLALPKAEQPTADQLSFVLLGNPSNPDGGLLARFGDPSLPPLSIPSIGMTFSGAAPSDTPWDTAIYTIEYDGFADFPRYPINLLADLNAFLGIMYQHGEYPYLTDARLATAIELPVSDHYAGHTQYFMIPTENLPLLEPLRAIPVVGNPLADLLEPDLRVLVNLGYGSITDGWDNGPADLSTPFGLFPTDINPADVLTALIAGAQRGVHDAVQDLSSPSLLDLSDPDSPNLLSVLDTTTDSAPPTITGIVNALSGALAQGYATLLPTADIVNFLLTTLPAYNVSLFAQELAAGDLVDAIGMPIAADVGLVTMSVGFELRVISGAVTSIIETLQNVS